MNIGGGLSYVTGPMGAGKTLFGCRKIVQSLAQGKYVVTNIRLREDWETYAAKRILRYSPLSWHKETALAAKLKSHYIYLDNFEDATYFQLPPRKGRASHESRGVMIWDEVHNDLNNRDWMEAGRKEMLKWGTQLRKLGFSAFFLSQHADNTEVALRRICGYQIRLQNQREQTRLLGFRVTPWPLFLAFWYPANVVQQKGGPVLTERYFLSWHRNIYDTLDLYHGLHSEYQANTKVMTLPDGGIDADILAAWRTDRELDRTERMAALAAAQEMRRRGAKGKLTAAPPNLRVLTPGVDFPAEGTRMSESG